MLAHFLALAVAVGSIALYLSAFFFPEIHRKKDFIWSGVGLFYALMLWVFSRRITGGLFLGHVASVALIGWFGWQTLQLRRQLTPEGQKTSVPSMGTVQTKIQEQLEEISISEKLTQLLATITSTFSAKKAQFQQKQNVTTSTTEPTTLDKAAIDAIADAENPTEVAQVKVEPPSEQIASPEVQAIAKTAEEKVEVTSLETDVSTTKPEETGKKTTDDRVKPEETEVKNKSEAFNPTEFTIVTPGSDEESDIPEYQVSKYTSEEKNKTAFDKPEVENTEAENKLEIVDITEFTIATPGGKEVESSETSSSQTPSSETQSSINTPEEMQESIEEATFIQIKPEDLSREEKRPDYPTF